MSYLIDLFTKSSINDEFSYQTLKQLGILHEFNPTCTVCFTQTNIERGKRRHGFNGCFRCKNRSCRKRYSLLDGTIFENTRLSFSDISKLILNYFNKNSQKDISLETNIAISTINNFFSKFRKKITMLNNDLNNSFMPGEIFEVDETHLFSRKNVQGRILNGQKFWCIGIFSRDKNIRLKISRRRNSEVLSEFITHFVPTGKTIISDFWRGYNNLKFFYNHKKINHKLHFVDPEDNSIHTNNIERIWRELKKKLKNLVDLEIIEEYIQEFVVLYNKMAKTKEEKMCVLIEALKL